MSRTQQSDDTVVLNEATPSIYVETPLGRFAVSLPRDGAFGIEIRSQQDTLVVQAGGPENVVRVIPWPTFQPVVPPTAEEPVRVPRDLVEEVMKPHMNGVGQESVEAVQAEVAKDPWFKQRLAMIIEQTLTKKWSSGKPGVGYESVIVRKPQSEHS